MLLLTAFPHPLHVVAGPHKAKHGGEGLLVLLGVLLGA